MELRALAFAFATAVTASSLWAGSAGATSCTNDIDCATGGTACGTDVCDWSKAPIQTCKPAAQSPGWCSADTDCKCASLGAHCNTASFSCTFVLPDAGAGGSSSSGSGGSSSSTSSSGTSSSGGSSSSGAGSSSDGGRAPSSSTSSGGCSLGGSGSPWGFATIVAAVGIGLARRRSRRSCEATTDIREKGSAPRPA